MVVRFGTASPGTPSSRGGVSRSRPSLLGLASVILLSLMCRKPEWFLIPLPCR